MKVLYYTSPAFLDIAIEVINILKKHVDLHVIIEITPGSKMSNILEIDKLPHTKTIRSLSEIIKKDNYKHLEPYFNGCASANFVVHPYQYGSSLSTIKISYILWRFVKSINPAVIHIETMSLRSLGLMPFLFSKINIFITIHDVIPHSSKKDWKITIPRLLYLKLPYSKSYFFYSKFSKLQFLEQNRKKQNPNYLLTMYPYSYYQVYNKRETVRNKHILLFGSLSRYKGIDVLLCAMQLVLKEFPNELLIIAGKGKGDNLFNKEIIEKSKDKIVVLNRYIPSDELAILIQESKFVVCPYLDATQSGVLMTSYALNTPVVASNVGAFPEYIKHKINGLLVTPNNHVKLADNIKLALRNNFFETMKENILKMYKPGIWSNNTEIILNAYAAGR